MADTRISDFNEVQVAFGAVPIEGWGTGDVLTISWENDAFIDTVGNNGDVSRAKTNDGRATVEIRTLRTSLVNAALSAILLADLNAPGGAGIGAFTCADLNGTSLYVSGNAWILRHPDVSLSNEPTEVTWTIRVAQMRAFTGGNL